MYGYKVILMTLYILKIKRSLVRLDSSLAGQLARRRRGAHTWRSIGDECAARVSRTAHRGPREHLPWLHHHRPPQGVCLVPPASARSLAGGDMRWWARLHYVSRVSARTGCTEHFVGRVRPTHRVAEGGDAAGAAEHRDAALRHTPSQEHVRSIRTTCNAESRCEPQPPRPTNAAFVRI